MSKNFLFFKAFLLFLLFLSIYLFFYVFPYKPQEGFELTLSDERRILVYERMIVELRKRQDDCQGSLYCKRPETQHIDCGRVLRGDKEYIKSISGLNRVPLVENPQLRMSCKAIKSRVLRENLHLKPLKSGVAFARIVFRDYEFIEKLVQMSFHPQNVFCFAVDRKAPPEFHMKMKALDDCFDNVIVLPATEEYDSKGHNINLAHYRCMQELLQFPTWNYLLLLQNHDVVTKSIYELERIYEILGGANDVSMEPLKKRRKKKGFKWDPRSLKLFRNETGIPIEVLDTPMTLASGYSEASVSREAVEWMVKTVDLTEMIRQWNYTEYGSDEQLLPTLQANPQLGMPGHFSNECVKQGRNMDQISRMTQWEVGGAKNCATGELRHDICILGIENFRGLAKMPTLVFNKMIPSFDYSIVECAAELLHNRTFRGQVDHELNENYYKSMINVLYHKHHLEPDYKLKCNPSYSPWTLPMEM